MKRIRIGKDLKARWTILTNGESISLHGRDLRLEVVNRFGRKEWEFTIEAENVVVFTLPGMVQRYLGEYTFTLWENYGKAGQTAVDSCGGIELVPTTCMEGGDSGPDTEPVELETASLELGVSGASAYETWLAEGHEGTEEDFLAWLRQPATDAADNALDAAKTATDAASKAESATEEMEQLYDVALAAESERQKAEQDREQAESERQTEFARLKEESEAATRAANEAAESAEQAAENANAAAEGIDNKISGKQDRTDQSLMTTNKTVAGAINEVCSSLGVYDTSISLPMTVEKSGKYVDPDGQEKSSASMGISAPLEVRSGNIYLLQCAAAVGTGVALFSRKVTNTYDKVIAYSYAYNGDGTIATATADYDPELVYSYSYNEEGVATITDKEGETVPELPATHQVTESFYEPLFRTNDATMPKSGYYLLLCTQDMEIVVSAASSDITGKNLLGVRYGVFASIATNFVGSPGQKVIAQAFAELYAAVQALSSVVDNAGHLKADVLDMANLPKVCGEDMYLTGEGAPAAPPTVPFQEYYDSENLKFYKAKGVLPDSPTTGDWVAIN